MGNDNLFKYDTSAKGIDKFFSFTLHTYPKDMHGACTTISVYENLSKNSSSLAQENILHDDS